MGFVARVLIKVLGGLWGLFSGAPYMKTPDNGSMLKNWPKIRTKGNWVKFLGPETKVQLLSRVHLAPRNEACA